MTTFNTDTATTNFDKTVNVLIRKQLEEELLPSLPHTSDFAGGLKATFVKGTNSTMRFLRVPMATATTNSNSVSPGTAPWLTEGVAPDGEELAIGYEELTSYQMGRRWTLTDVADMESILDLQAEIVKVCARAAAETYDLYVANVIAAGTNVLYAGSGNTARTDVGALDVLTGSLVRRGAANLEADNVPTFGDGSYHAIINPSAKFDFEEDDDVGGWLHSGSFADPGKLGGRALGQYAGVKFATSSAAVKFAAGGAGGVDVFSTVIMGPQAFAIGDWGTVSFHFVPMKAAPGNELGQVSSYGFKGFVGAILIDEAGARYIRIESGSGL